MTWTQIFLFITFLVDIKKVASKSTTKVGMKHITTVVKKDMAMVAVTTIMRKKKEVKSQKSKSQRQQQCKRILYFRKVFLGLAVSFRKVLN